MKFNIITRLLTLLCITTSLVSARMSLALAREDEDPAWLVDRIDPKCSKPCGGGVRRVTYKCAVYKHSSGETFTVDSARCDAVSKPPDLKPCNQEQCFFQDEPAKPDSAKSPYKWKSTHEYSKCINGCFGGTRCIINRCWNSDLKSWASDTRCDGLEEPRKLCETCREYVSCPPQWRTSEWSACSRSCGSGVRTREVFCANQLGADHFTKVDDNRCEKNPEPHSSERCAKVDCPVEFATSKWGPCKNANSQNCGVGSRKRKIMCTMVTGHGVVKNQKIRTCIRALGRKKFPPMWITCTDYSIKLSDNCKRKRKNVAPSITSDNSTIYQMKRSRRMRLQVGQTAYVFPRTAVTMKCPVKDFDPRDLIWTHDDNIVKTLGRRIQVNFKGRVKIRSVRKKDRGIWRCQAGTVNASVSLNLQYPTEGFREYAIRQPLLTKMARSMLNTMMSDSTGIRMKTRKKGKKNQGKSKGRRRIPVQWVSGPWTPCSRTCGGMGQMSRRVTCERVKDTFFKIYPDENCLKQGLIKPNATKECGGFNVCPLWQIDNNRGKCTNQCVRPRFALQKDRVFCGVNNQRLPLKFCDQSQKPEGVAECANSKCQLEWKVSNWSACSRSCGGRGIQARTIQCIWKNTGALAGYNCFKYEIKQPVSMKSCNTPKCILACVDLTPQCDTIKASACRYFSFQRYCCKTCERFIQIHKLKKKIK